MAYDVEGTDEFKAWYRSLDEGVQDRVAASIDLLEEVGPNLAHPHSSAILGSRLGRLRELRISALGRPIRVLYAFDPRRSAILLLGGDKTGDDGWYDRSIPMAERLYAEHLKLLESEGLL